MGNDYDKRHYLLYLIEQIKKSNLSKVDSTEKEFLSIDHNLIIKILYYKLDDGFIIKDKSKSKYFILRKIRTSLSEMSKIINTLEKIELLTSDKFFNFYHYLIQDDQDNNGKLIYILFEGGNSPMKQLDMKKNDLTYNEKLMIFINILFSMKILEINKIQLGNLIPENIYYSRQENNSKKLDVKLLGYKDIIDNIYLENNNFYNYFAPEKLEDKSNPKSNIWSLGCILYELLFNDKLFPNKSDIFNLKYEFCYKELEKKFQNISVGIKIGEKKSEEGKNKNEEYDENLINFFSKVICHVKKRLTLDEVLHEKFVINILKENNYFYELIKDNLIEIGFKYKFKEDMKSN